ncbi:YhbD family protein [Paenibacillus ferrarius]|uniref:YhbD family protein n=1 Tax=Paenibacillus ferrarius TaxID=1469647 RepID=UPI003D2DD32E
MEDDLISKKELLELTGISYGQLYRWKRKNLIPEAWFIRKSAFTGQETFFPRALILARIDKITNMKDDLSLDELADVFSVVPSTVQIDWLELVKRNIVSQVAAEHAASVLGKADTYSFAQTLFLYMLEDGLQSGEMNVDEGRALLLTLQDNYGKFEGQDCDLLFFRKMGVCLFLLASAGSEVFAERGAKEVLRVNVGKKIEELKLKLTTV